LALPVAFLLSSRPPPAAPTEYSAPDRDSVLPPPAFIAQIGHLLEAGVHVDSVRQRLEALHIAPPSFGSPPEFLRYKLLLQELREDLARARGKLWNVEDVLDELGSR